MDIVKQITVLATNQPGTLADICGSLSDEKINILGVSVIDHVDHALIRLVVDKPVQAAHLLGEAGLMVVESDVIRAELTDGPGILEHVAKLMSDASININYVYATEAREGISTLILNTGDNQRAVGILNRNMAGNRTA
ncbi:MAG: ACT domain-containing protein [Spirochaetia bacterium]|nr:ACT domain-containing protein [Spirochaetia bacterium]